MSLFLNKKNGQMYKVITHNLVNATNGQEGRFVTQYYKLKEGTAYIPGDEQVYVRDTEEFMQKFEEVIVDK